MRAPGCACSERDTERSLRSSGGRRREVRVEARMTAPTGAAGAPRGSRKATGKPHSKGALCAGLPAPAMREAGEGSPSILGDRFRVEETLSCLLPVSLVLAPRFQCAALQPLRRGGTEVRLPGGPAGTAGSRSHLNEMSYLIRASFSPSQLPLCETQKTTVHSGAQTGLMGQGQGGSHKNPLSENRAEVEGR